MQWIARIWTACDYHMIIMAVTLLFPWMFLQYECGHSIDLGLSNVREGAVCAENNSTVSPYLWFVVEIAVSA